MIKRIIIFLLLCTSLAFGASSDYKVDNQGAVHAYDIITKGPWVDPRAFGAVGDGVTDDSVAIQSAINSISSGNVLLVKMYGVGHSGWVGLQLKSNVNIIAQSGGGLRILAAPSQNNTQWAGVTLPTVFYGNGVSEVAISGLEINGNSTAASLVSFYTGTDCKVTGNYIHDVTGQSAAIHFEHGFKNYISGNRIENVGVAIYTGGTAPGWSEYNVQIINNRVNTTTWTDGIVGVMQYSVIQGNILENLNISGISLSCNGTGDMSHNVTVTGNEIKNTVTGHGIQSDEINGGTLADVTITGNLFEGLYGSGIYLINTQNSVVTGNRIKNFSLAGATGGAGILINNSQEITVTGNRINNATAAGWGIELLSYSAVSTNYCDSITVTGNIVSNVAENGIWAGIVSAETYSNITVIGNKVDTVTTYDGIAFTAGGTNLICSENIVVNANRYSYYFDSSLQETAQGNTLIASGTGTRNNDIEQIGTIPYGQMWYHNDSAPYTIALTTGTPAKIACFDTASDGQNLNGFTYSTSALTCLIAGTYKVNYSQTMGSSTSNHIYRTRIAINGVEQLSTASHTKPSNSTDERASSGCGIIALNVNDVVTIQMTDTTAGNSTATLFSLNVNLDRVGN
jgi:polygalacturonase